MINDRNIKWSDLVYYDTKVKEFVNSKTNGIIRLGGVTTLETLPQPDESQLNYIYSMSDTFVTDSRFIESGKEYNAGTNIQCVRLQDRYCYVIFFNPIDPRELVDLSGIESSIDTLQTTVEQLDSTISNTSTLLEHVTETVTSNADAIQDIQQHSEEFESQTTSVVTELSQQTATLESDMQAANDELSSQDSRLENIETSHSSLNTRVGQLKTDLESCDNSVARLEDQKQNTLVSGVNLSTINGQSLLTGENIEIDVPETTFTVDRVTDIAVGGLPTGISLNGWTINQILEKMLFTALDVVALNPAPGELVGGFNPAYTGTTASDEFTALGYSLLEETPLNKISCSNIGFYNVYDAESNLTQRGFQVTTVASGRSDYDVILLPKNIVLNAVYVWNEVEANWTICNNSFVKIKEVEALNSNSEKVNYYMYRDSSTSSSERHFRFSII